MNGHVRSVSLVADLPRVGDNNVWYRYRGTKTCFVFVHGIFSDSRSCWLLVGSNGDPEVYWPDLISSDTRFKKYSIYLGGYYTALDAGSYKVRHCADELFQALRRRESENHKSVLEHETIVFVCHSTGGIVVRYILDSRTPDFENKTIGLVLIASPSYGSALATFLGLLSRFYNQELGQQLEWGNDSLDSLDERFHRLLKERRIPRLLGIEAYENHFIFHRKWLPDRRVVVTKESAERYFAPARMLAKTNHFTSVKPNGRRHPAYLLLVDFCTDLDARAVQWGAGSKPPNAPTPAEISEKLAEIRRNMIMATTGRELENLIHEVEGVVAEHPNSIEARQLRADLERSLEAARPTVSVLHPTRSVEWQTKPRRFRTLARVSAGLVVVLVASSLVYERFQSPKSGSVDQPLGLPSPTNSTHGTSHEIIVTVRDSDGQVVEDADVWSTDGTVVRFNEYWKIYVHEDRSASSSPVTIYASDAKGSKPTKTEVTLGSGRLTYRAITLDRKSNQ